MDSALSEFIAHTGADPGLARDILEGQQWDLSKSLQAYYFLRGITAVSVTPNLATMVAPPLSDGDSRHSAAVLKEDAFPPGRPPPLKSKQQHEYNDSRLQSTAGSCSPSRPILQKVDAVDVDDNNKKLARGISRATDNVNLVSKARSEFALNFQDPTASDYLLDFIIETPVYTFTLPDLTIYQEDFVAFLEKDLIETSTLVSLEQAGRLNWWTESGACQRLWPLATTGDGNCLLHAASLGMWGFHDRLLTLRKALHATLTKGPYRQALWRRWRFQQTFQNREAGLVYSEEEWQKEWKSILRLSSTEPRSGPSRKAVGGCDTLTSRSVLDTVKESQRNSNSVGHDIYESLEEAHVLALAHVLRRPIIVVADTMLKDVTGEPFAPIPFGGVYLPLECQPSQCHRSPLVLTYDAAHFSALVAMDREAYLDKTPQPAAVIPLTDSDHRLLPLQFAVDPGENFAWDIDENNTKVVSSLTLTTDDKLALLHHYLDLEHVSVVNATTAEKKQQQLMELPALANGSLDVASVEKKSSGSSFESDDSSSPSSTETSSVTSSGGLLSSGLPKNRASKQFQSVARHFGSIGRSMSKRIKKNLGNFKLGRSNSYKEGSSAKQGDSNNVEEPSPAAMGPPSARQRHTLPSTVAASKISKGQNYILAARLNAERRHEYQEEMLKNYLQSARLRFEKIAYKQAVLCEKKIPPPRMLCMNTGCSMIGNSATDDLCTDCYDKTRQQQQQQQHCDNVDGDVERSNTLYGIGKSRFYAESSTPAEATQSATTCDAQLKHNRSQLQTVSINKDKTLYLSNSTFYNDVNTPSIAADDRKLNGDDAEREEEDDDDDDDEDAEEEDEEQETTTTTMNDVLRYKHVCRTPKCSFYGTPELNYYCSQCHKQNKVSRMVNTYSRLGDRVRTTQM